MDGIEEAGCPDFGTGNNLYTQKSYSYSRGVQIFMVMSVQISGWMCGSAKILTLFGFVNQYGLLDHPFKNVGPVRVMCRSLLINTKYVINCDKIVCLHVMIAYVIYNT